MNRPSCDQLCGCIISKVGDAVFKSQEWLDSCSHDDEETTTRTNVKRPRTQWATNALGGTFSGELKVAVMLCLMAGASYLDLLLIFGICTSSIYNVFHKAIAWIVATF